MKIRVHELANDLGVSSKLLLSIGKERGLKLRSHMTALDDHALIVLRDAVFDLQRFQEVQAAEKAKKKAEEEERKAKEKKAKEEAKKKAAEKKRKEREKKAKEGAKKKTRKKTAPKKKKKEAPSGEEKTEEPAAKRPIAEKEEAVAVLEPLKEAPPVIPVEEETPAPPEAPPEKPVKPSEKIAAEAPPELEKEKDEGPAAEAKAPERAIAEAPPAVEKPGAKKWPSEKKAPPVKPSRQKATIITKIELPKEPPPKAPSAPKEKPPLVPQADERIDFFRAYDSSLYPLAEKEKRTYLRPPIHRERRPPGRFVRKKQPKVRKAPVITPVITPEEVSVTLPISVKEISNALGIKAAALLRFLLLHGMHANINSFLDKDQIELIGIEFQRTVNVKEEKNIEKDLIAALKEESRTDELLPRAPIVTFLGHVDHGKTSLLDAIRETKVAQEEAGGITQHIGAYKVTDRLGHPIVFLDTPGHEDFTAMRARGANVTDIVVLVVAADDGVMPQTEEAINHARAAGVPIVVAINKIDKRNANPLRTKQQLASLGLHAEEWGGKTVMVEVSALTKQGIEALLEMIALEAELLELKASRNKKATGRVLDARLTEGKGITVNLLLMDGTLRVGDSFLCGQCFGKVRTILDDKGFPLSEAYPAAPLEITGLQEIPEAGDWFYVVDDLGKAKEVAEIRKEKIRRASMAERQHVTLENLYDYIKEGKAKELNIILKADVKGSVEALEDRIRSLSTDEIRIRILHSGVGGINESDVLLADASDAIIIGFHVIAEEKARALAEEKNVEIKLYQVIYHASDDIKAAIEGMLEPEEHEKIHGHLEIKEVFRISRIGNIAGCRVNDGFVRRSSLIRLVRDNRAIYSGKIESLKHFKDDVKEVREGFECGLKIFGYDDIKVGDILEAYEVERIARKLE